MTSRKFLCAAFGVMTNHEMVNYNSIYSNVSANGYRSISF